MKFRVSVALATLAAVAVAQPASARERVFEGSDTFCTIEVRDDLKALLMTADAEGNSQIGLMFKADVDTPGRTLEGYFSMRFDFSTSGPVTYREGFESPYANGYIADLSTVDLLWILDETEGRLSFSVGGTAHRFEALTGEDIAEFAAFRGCVVGLAN